MILFKRKHRKNIKLFACLLASCVIMSGCETVTLLSEEEEDLVVYYAAKVVAKHNVRLGQGIVRYMPKENTDQTESDTEDTQTDAAASVSQESDSAASVETPETPAESSAESKSDAEEAVSLSKAIGIKGVSFEIKKVKSYKNYTQKNLAMRSPAPGNRYVVVNVNVKNTTSDAMTVSMLDKSIRFSAELGGQTQSAQATMSLEDLPTYEKKINAGESDKGIILFEFPEELANDLSGLNLTVENNGTKYPIKY